MSAIADDIWTILRELAQSQKETDQKFQETAQRFRETDLQLRETDRKIKEVTTSIGKLGNRLGDFIEDAVRPAAVRLFQSRGIAVHEVHQNISAQREDGGIEIDLLVVNESEVVAIECKSNLSIDDVDDHLARLCKFKKMLPTYANKRVIGAVASMVIADNVAQYAYRKGLYVIGQSGDHLEIRNEDHFMAKAW